MVPANILECQVHVGLLWHLWTAPFLIHIHCASHALLWWKCAGSVLLWSHTAVRPAECGLVLGGPFPGHDSMISIICKLKNLRTLFFLMSLGKEKSAVFLDVVDLWLALYVFVLTWQTLFTHSQCFRAHHVVFSCVLFSMCLFIWTLEWSDVCVCFRVLQLCCSVAQRTRSLWKWGG